MDAPQDEAEKRAEPFLQRPDDPLGKKDQQNEQQEPGEKVFVLGRAPQQLGQHGEHQPAESRSRQRADAPQNSHGDVKNGDGKNECVRIDELGEPGEQAAGNSGIECSDGERDGLVMGEIDAHCPRRQFILPNGDKRPSVS